MGKDAQEAAERTAFLRARIAELGLADEAARDRFAAALTIAPFAKGWQFVSQGGTSTQIGILLSGLVKFCAAAKNGGQLITAFACEGAVIADYTAIVRRSAATVTIEALEPGWIATIDAVALDALGKTDPAIDQAQRRVIESEFAKIAQRAHDLIGQTPEDAYQRFFAENPALVNRIMRKDLAAYFGISAVSLSRMSARVLKKKRKTPQ